MLCAVMALVTAMTTLQLAAAPQAEAQNGKSCPAGTVHVGSKCLKNPTYSCPPGYSLLGRTCNGPTQYSCPYGGYLIRGTSTCRVFFWGRWGSYKATPSPGASMPATISGTQVAPTYTYSYGQPTTTFQLPPAGYDYGFGNVYGYGN